jgi:hypothetical protein
MRSGSSAVLSSTSYAQSSMRWQLPSTRGR